MIYNTINSVWTDERVERLKVLWAANKLSCNGIATELGGGITRNAVIGKALRLGLDKKSHTPTTQRISRRRVPPSSIRKVCNPSSYLPRDDEEDQPFDADVSSLAKLEAQTPPASFLGITFKNLNENHCRYIRTIDDVNLYCGQPKIKSSAYCRECHKRCHSRGWYLLNGRKAA